VNDLIICITGILELVMEGSSMSKARCIMHMCFIRLTNAMPEQHESFISVQSDGSLSLHSA
jgi:glutamine synthetase type III